MQYILDIGHQVHYAVAAGGFQLWCPYSLLVAVVSVLPGYCDGIGLEIDIRPAQSQSLAAPETIDNAQEHDEIELLIIFGQDFKYLSCVLWLDYRSVEWFCFLRQDCLSMGEVAEINLLEMMGGAVGERVSYELAKIMRNCKDLNTEAKKARTLTVEFAIVPTDARDSAAVRVSVKSKLVPVKALDTTLLIGGTQDEPVVMEYTPQLPGQRNFAGGEQEEPKMIRLADAKQA